MDRKKERQIIQKINTLHEFNLAVGCHSKFLEKVAS